jgi:NADH dehydrogenase FAD-containing subunit
MMISPGCTLRVLWRALRRLVTSDRLKVSAAGDDASAVPAVWALGDCAAVAGGRYAATAQVAEQQGEWLAAAFNDAAADAGAFDARPPSRAELAAALDAHVPRYAFAYHHRGSLAMLGTLAGAADFTAVARTGGARGVADVALGPLRGATLRGAAAWLLWRSAYLTKLGRWRNRLQVPADWARAAIFGRDTTLF